MKVKSILKIGAFFLPVTLCVNVTNVQIPAEKKPEGAYIRALTPARGYYKELASFDPAPKSPNEEVDKRKFITAQSSIEKRLSLKPVYLDNVSADDFKLPNPPANHLSSNSFLLSTDNQYFMK